jgi:hypothetical protein
MHSYLVTLSNGFGEIQKIIVQTPVNCIHDMQEFVDGLTDLQIQNAIVIDIDADAAQHVPIKETSL